jgi:hypothetical protein
MDEKYWQSITLGLAELQVNMDQMQVTLDQILKTTKEMQLSFASLEGIIKQS